MQGAIVIGLQNKFKEFRRDKKPVKKPVIIAAPVTVVSRQPWSPTKQLMKRPEIEAGEDEGSYERFAAQILEEFKKKKPRSEVLSFLFETTYAHRRQEIIDNPSLVSDVLKKHQFLKIEEHVSTVLSTVYLITQTLLYWAT